MRRSTTSKGLLPLLVIVLSISSSMLLGQSAATSGDDIHENSPSVDRPADIIQGPLSVPITQVPADSRLSQSQISTDSEAIKPHLDHNITTTYVDDLSISQSNQGSPLKPRVEELKTPNWTFQAMLIGGLIIVALMIFAQILGWTVAKESRKLAHREAQYHRFFDGLATALCEGDSSRALINLQLLIESGEDIRTYFNEHPDELRRYLNMIRIVNANPEALKLYAVSSLHELQQWIPKSITPDISSAFKEFLVATSKGEEKFSAEMSMLAADGRLIRVFISFPLSKSLQAARHIPVSMLDITHQRQTERQLSLVIKGASLGFWDWNLTTSELTVNDRWMEILGLNRSDLKNHIDDMNSRIHPMDRDRIQPIVEQHIEESTPYKVEFRMRHSDGHWIWIEGSGGTVEYDPHTNRPTRVCGTHQEITDRKRASETLHTLMRSMVGISGGDFFKHVARELCRWFEADSANIGELTDDNHIKSLAMIVDGKDIEDFQYPIEDTPCNLVLREGPQLYPQGVQDLFPGDEDLVLINAQGYAGSPILDPAGKAIGLVWVTSDKPLFMDPEWADVMEIIAARVSAEIERMHATTKLEHQATFDALTELPNRRLLIDRLGQALARCQRHNHRGAVLFMDLDHFKIINDSLGHNIGDLLLKEVASRLIKQIRDEDTASRLGGDEFVVLFSELSSDPQLAAQQAQQGAHKILHTLSQPYTISGNKLHITPSIGIVIFPMDSKNANDILKFADTAMYRAKDAGRNTIRFFLPGMQHAAEAQLKLQNDLRLAIRNNQLALYFQPQIDINGDLFSAEALLRWSHPEQGLIEASTIISVAEESGQILQISEWVLKQALSLSKKWIKESTSLQRISINISSVHFHQVGFADQVKRILQETSVNPNQLTLEINENTLAENLEEAKGKIQTLKKLGVRFCIDSFGIGYASIAYLRQLPMDELKIDRSFVLDIATDPKDAQLVQTIITMAHLMEIEVIAIGVETDAQLQFLRDNGCKMFQGYYFNHPLSADQFDLLLKKLPV